ncbi:MAG TPA: hypothetical protein VIN08_17285 [Ohtaekwangia sp.]|uniref:hypothetical protein n=1 Tax=Ohtaekwangia sp. TaxID=2066019 RepID=UPI002F926A52
MIKKFFAPVAMLCAILFVSSCSSDDDSTAVVADFSLSVSGQAPNATVTITNSTTGAVVYGWAFSAGANVSTSLDKDPAALTVDKAGTFEVTLVATSGSDTKTVVKTVEIEGNSAIVTYTDVAFAREAGSSTYGRFFSTQTGLIYKDSEVNSTTGPKIDLAFSQLGTSVNYFTSPDDANEKFGIAGATTTKVINYPEGLGVTPTVFDNATDESFIKNVAIDASDEESFGTSNPYIILFETASGKKGAIKTTAINGERLLVNIKVQKY